MGRVNLETLSVSRRGTGPSPSADPISFCTADAAERQGAGEAGQATGLDAALNQLLRKGGNVAARLRSRDTLKERSKHSGQEKGGASHCGAQERLVCFEVRKAAGLFPSQGEVLLLSKMLIYDPKVTGARG